MVDYPLAYMPEFKPVVELHPVMKVYVPYQVLFIGSKAASISSP